MIDCGELEIDTLGGYVFHIAQRIPSRGEIIDGPRHKIPLWKSTRAG